MQIGSQAECRKSYRTKGVIITNIIIIIIVIIIVIIVLLLLLLLLLLYYYCWVSILPADFRKRPLLAASLQGRVAIHQDLPDTILGFRVEGLGFSWS